MSEWQRIESAPKNGTRILSFAADAADPVDTAYWKLSIDGDGIDGTWRDDGCCPTHWMPLPESPVSAPTQSTEAAV